MDVKVTYPNCGYTVIACVYDVCMCTSASVDGHDIQAMVVKLMYLLSSQLILTHNIKNEISVIQYSI